MKQAQLERTLQDQQNALVELKDADPAVRAQLQRLHQLAWEKQLSRSAAPELVG